MKTTRSRLERRLAQLLATTPPPPTPRLTVPPSAGRARVDVVYLTEDDHDRLNSCLGG